MNLRKDFEDFLLENKALRAWQYAMQADREEYTTTLWGKRYRRGNHINNIYFFDSVKPDQYVIDGFWWTLTPKGYNFWNNLDNLWQIRLKELKTRNRDERLTSAYSGSTSN